MIKLSRSKLEFKRLKQLVYKLYGLAPDEIAVVGGINMAKSDKIIVQGRETSIINFLIMENLPQLKHAAILEI